MNKENQSISIAFVGAIEDEQKENPYPNNNFIRRLFMKYKSINWCLSNKYIFFGSIVLSISILTGINNFYFYSHVARENDRNAEKIRIVVDGELALCAENNIDISSCTKNIVSTIDKVAKHYYYVTNATLLDFKGNVLWVKEKNNHDKVAVLSIKIQLPDFKVSTKASFDIQNQWSNANILLSVVRSMTFSVAELTNMVINDGMEAAYNRFTTVAWYRSRPAIGFAFFTILLFMLYRKRELARDEEMAENERELVELEKERSRHKRKNRSLQQEIDDIESEKSDVAKKIQTHDKVINPPLNTLKYEQFLDLDPESVIFKCRKVAEKLVIQIYNKEFKIDDWTPLHKKIQRLSKEKIIDSKIVTLINTIKAFGNLSAHPNVRKPIEFTREDALMVSSTLILLIEELGNSDLLIE